MARRYWLETLGCPKNQVDSEKLAGALRADGLEAAGRPEDADLLVVNTCAFVEAARAESIEAILALAERRRPGGKLVVTGCLAERAEAELARALPEVDLVGGFGVAPQVILEGPRPRRRLAVASTPRMDLLELPRPPAAGPWAYLKVAEGCDRRCGFCAIPSFRGPQRSRSPEALLAELESLGPAVREVVLVAQDLASYGLDRQGPAGSGRLAAGPRPLVGLVEALATRVPRVRLLYLYPSSVDQALIETVVGSGLPYFDLSLQHASARLLRTMRRPGGARQFLALVDRIRALAPEAAVRSSFVVGYPGETEEDHDALLAFLEEAQLDWAGFFPFSKEEGTYAASLPDPVPEALVAERLGELSALQAEITEDRQRRQVGRVLEVLVDQPGQARSYREAPEIDGVIRVPPELPVGQLVPVVVTGAAGPELFAEPLADEPDAARAGR
ncbi:30S ribosomal protein S12 methylthiotransferase RimO [Aciditerrimonas ferrireducens]|uniref:Ribosomal protein uS12 methylthiotransferase RimO n=1 Tax=Aciditerrimonas ferrireducens TaxID=667306 RepID=A0ABV6C426_9ACTN